MFGTSINESRIARKEHVCCDCEKKIKAGEKYQYYKTAFLDDDNKFCWNEYKSHAACYEKILKEAEEDTVTLMR